MKKGGTISRSRKFLIFASIVVILLAYMVLAFTVVPSTASPHPQNNSQWHDIVTFNITTGFAESIKNVTFRIQSQEDSAFILNFTVFNSSNNSEGDWHLRFNSRTVVADEEIGLEGGYNLTVELYNTSYDGTLGVEIIEINGLGGEGNAGFFIVNTRPKAHNITINESLSDFQNFSFDVSFNVQAVVNDSLSTEDSQTGISRVIFRVWNATASFNVSASTTHTFSPGTELHKNISLWNATIDMATLGLNGGSNYNISVLVNDTVKCKDINDIFQCLPNLNDTTYLTFGILEGLVVDDNTLSITTEVPSPKNGSTWHDTLILNISTVSGSVMNVTFKFQDVDTNAFYNFTVFNSSNNTEGYWFISISTRGQIVDGYYNVTVELYNRTYDGTTGFATREFLSGDNDGVIIHNFRPGAINLTFAGSLDNFQNFTDSKGFVNEQLRLQAVVNDNTDQEDGSVGISKVIFRVWNSTNSYNITGSTNHTAVITDTITHKNTSLWNATLDLQLIDLSEGNYNISVEVNDTVFCQTLDDTYTCLPNLNSTTYLTFGLDFTVPKVIINNPNKDENNYSRTTGNITFNVSVLDINTLTTSVLFSFDNGTGTAFNITATNKSGYWSASYNVSTLAESADVIITVLVNDSFGNLNWTQTMIIVTDFTSPNISVLEPDNNRNFTSTGAGILIQNQTINMSIKEDNDNGAGLFQVVFQFDNSTGVDFNVTPTNGSGYWAASYNLSNLIEGYHTITYYASDYSGNVHNNLIRTFTVDNTNPLTDWITNNNSNYSKSSFNKTFNVSIKDLTIQSVFFSFDNGTGTAFNVTATNGSGYWTASYNVSSLAEGNITITVWANDTLGNINNSIMITLTTDYTSFFLTNLSSGSLGSSEATITWNSSSTANGTVHYGTTLALGSATSTTTFGLQHTVALSGLSGSTIYFFNVTSCDYAGNCNTTGNSSNSFTTTAAASSNTGSGGSSSPSTSTTTSSPSAGTATAGKIGTSEPVAPSDKVVIVAEFTQEFAEIAANEVATVNVAASQPSIGVTSVSFSVNSPVSQASVTVAEIVSLPEWVTEFTGKTYKNLEITHSESITAENLVAPKIEFKVSIVWLAENDLTAESVALHRYAEDKWNELSTTITSSDGEFQYYSAETPGFSLFVIGERTAVVEGTPLTESEVQEPAVGIGTRTIALSGTGLIIIIAIFLIWWVNRQQKKK